MGSQMALDLVKISFSEFSDILFWILSMYGFSLGSSDTWWEPSSFPQGKTVTMMNSVRLYLLSFSGK